MTDISEWAFARWRDEGEFCGVAESEGGKRNNKTNKNLVNNTSRM